MLSHRNTMLWKYYWVKSTTKFLCACVYKCYRLRNANMALVLSRPPRPRPQALPLPLLPPWNITPHHALYSTITHSRLSGGSGEGT